MDEYIAWLLKAYTEHAGRSPEQLDTPRKAVGILRRHAARWPREEDFIPMVALEMMTRLQALETDSPLPADADSSFLELLQRTADTVRHRIARDARNRLAHPLPAALDQMKPRAQHVVSESIADEIKSQLTVEQQAVLAARLDGLSVAEMAKQLGVSPRSVYRCLKAIRQRITES